MSDIIPAKLEQSIVIATGVGRADYSVGIEMTVEPVITSYQSAYLYRDAVVVPAGGSLVKEVSVPLDQVVLLYDFYATIPANRLIRMVVEAVASDETSTEVVNKAAYQTVEAHLSKGYPFFHIIRFTLYSYGDVDEDYMRIGCAGLYTSVQEFFIMVSPEIPLP